MPRPRLRQRSASDAEPGEGGAACATHSRVAYALRPLPQPGEVWADETP